MITGPAGSPNTQAESAFESVLVVVSALLLDGTVVGVVVGVAVGVADGVAVGLEVGVVIDCGAGWISGGGTEPKKSVFASGIFFGAQRSNTIRSYLESAAAFA